jgi:hypothetical protein
MLNSKLIIMSMLITVVFACKKEEETNYADEATCTSTPTYTVDIAPILNASCAGSGCHNASSKRAGIDLSTYAAAKNEFMKNNTALASIHHASGVKAMPQGQSKLADATINKLDCWVKNGCPE